VETRLSSSLQPGLQNTLEVRLLLCLEVFHCPKQCTVHQSMCLLLKEECNLYLCHINYVAYLHAVFALAVHSFLNSMKRNKVGSDQELLIHVRK